MKEPNFEGCKFTPLPFEEERREVKKKKRGSIKLVLAIVGAGLALLAGCVTLASQRRGESPSLSLPSIAILSTCKYFIKVKNKLRMTQLSRVVLVMT